VQQTDMWWPRINALKLSGSLLLVSLLINACAPLRGFPSDPTDAQVSNTAEQELTKTYYAVNTSKDQRLLLRNEIVSDRMTAYEGAYSDFKRRLNSDSNTLNLGADLSVLALAGLAATTGSISTATALAAASAGVIGAKASINSDIYFQRTLPALLAQMDANRAVAKLPIVRGLRMSDSTYPLAIALIDLDALRDAGGIPTAIGGLTQQAEAAKATAEQALSGFNTTSAAKCLQALIIKPDPEGAANRAKIASEARKLGANFQFVTEWVTDPKTDPNQLAAVARIVVPSCLSSPQS
jgi:hypothetical protein